MKLFIGGCFQGKSDFARRYYQEKEGKEISLEEWFSLAADGRKDSLEKTFLAPAVEAMQEYIRKISEKEVEFVQKKEQVQKWIKELNIKNPDVILVLDEVGCGIVPLKREEREYRDLVGYAGQLAAQNADCVYRVMMGMGEQIK